MEVCVDYFKPNIFQRIVRRILLVCYGAEDRIRGENTRFSLAEEKTKANINQRVAYYLSTYGNGIIRFAYSYLHNMEDAEDILQETMIKVLEMNPEFENLAHEKAYLFTVAGNLSKNRMKYNKLRRTDELDEVLTEEERADLSFVWHAVKDLPKNYREVIHLYYQEGYQTAEIATILDRREATVRSDLRRGREKLKNVLKEEYDFE